jgi:N-methylhydantoinase B
MDSVLKAFPHEWHSDDLVIFNDPYHGGMHLPDLFMIAPVLSRGVLIGFAVTTMHHADMGGRVPGSNAADSTEIFQEGLRIPPLKLVANGQTNAEILQLLLTNVRVPTTVRGDLDSQIAACKRGTDDMRQLHQAHRGGDFGKALDELLDYTEELTAIELETLEPGDYEFEDFIDSDGVNEIPLRIRVRLSIAGGRIIADFAGSSPQATGAITSTLSMTRSATYAAIRCVMGRDIPNNEGFFRRIEIRTEEGSIVHAAFPAPVAARGVTAFRIVDAVLGALGQAAPTRAIAAGDGGITVVVIAGYENGRPFASTEALSASWGATARADGIDGVAHPGVNIRNTPAELTERENPVEVVQFAYVPDSGGPGRFRGGLAIIKEWRILAEEVVVQVRADRQMHEPY